MLAFIFLYLYIPSVLVIKLHIKYKDTKSILDNGRVFSCKRPESGY